MRKKVVLLSLALCTFVLNCLVMPTKVEAKEPISICSLSAPITEENIINIEIIDGELYIDVLTKIDPNQASVMTRPGACPETYKYVTNQMTRAELIELRDELESDEKQGDVVISLLFGFVNWQAGLFTLAFTSATESAMLTEVQKGVDRKQSNYTVTSKFKCEQTNMGSRGIVHRYRFISITVV